MDQQVVGAIVGATLQVLLQNLITFASEEINLIWGMKKDLNKLKKTLIMIQAFLRDAERRQIGDEAFKIWLKNLETLAYEADIVLDEFSYEMLKRKLEPPIPMVAKVRRFSPISGTFSFRRTIAHKIKDINLNLKMVGEEASTFGLHRGDANIDVDPTLRTVVTNRETDSFTADPVFVGRVHDALAIVDLLVNPPSDKILCFVPIVGMGGIGKTTLARSVFNDERVGRHFPKRIWVCVSHNFEITKVFKLMLESLKQKSIHLESKQALLNEIQIELGGKPYLLVLDDVWDANSDLWDSFQRSLAGVNPVKGSNILITTRIRQVASNLASSNSFSLQKLSNDNCWSILKELTFGGAVPQADFEVIGRQIAAKCRGLPLAANVIGGMLRNREKDVWLSILNSELSDIDGDEKRVFQILKMSFDHLPNAPLKKCFAYCSIFPKDFNIDRVQLIEYWMAEGLLQPNMRADMESIGNCIFNKLTEHSLLHDVKKDKYGNVLFCKMHDLVNDLARSVSDCGSGHIQDDTADDPMLVGNFPLNETAGNMTDHATSEKVRHLRTLSLTDKNLQNFKCLRLLSLVNANLHSLPDSIGDLLHLRLIDVSYTPIRALPDRIGKLYHLQTLRSESCLVLEKLPVSINGLVSLRHLHIANVKLPPEIGKLTCLRTLPFFDVSNDKGYGIEELGCLTNLQGKLEIRHLENINDETKAKAADLFGKPNLRKLKLLWSTWRAADSHDENVLKCLQPNPNLKSLVLENFYGDKFPLWMIKMEVRKNITGPVQRLDNLIEIKLTGCSRCEELPTLGQLPLLKYLKLKGLINIKIIGISFYGIEECKNPNEEGFQDTRIFFPTLKRLTITDMPELVNWASATGCGAVFPSLEYLEFQNCLKLITAPSHFPCLKILRIDGMDSCLPFESICSNDLTTLTDVYLQSITELNSLPDWFFQKNQNLASLEFRHCPNLTSLVPKFEGCESSLRQLQIEYCEKLSELADDLHILRSLERLEIKFCPELKNISYATGHQGLTSLKSFVITNCDALTSLPSQMLESCVVLNSVSFSGCQNLSFPVDFRRLTSLSSIYIHQCPNLTSFPEASSP